LTGSVNTVTHLFITT